MWPSAYWYLLGVFYCYDRYRHSTRICYRNSMYTTYLSKKTHRSIYNIFSFFFSWDVIVRRTVVRFKNIMTNFCFWDWDDEEQKTQTDGTETFEQRIRIRRTKNKSGRLLFQKRFITHLSFRFSRKHLVSSEKTPHQRSLLVHMTLSLTIINH